MLPAFLTRRLAGEVPLAQLFWWDMLLVATLINLMLGGIALAAYVNGVPLWLAAIIFFSPLPYNALLCLGIWRTLERTPSPWGVLAKAGALLWLAIMLLV